MPSWTKSPQIMGLVLTALLALVNVMLMAIGWVMVEYKKSVDDSLKFHGESLHSIDNRLSSMETSVKWLTEERKKQ